MKVDLIAWTPNSQQLIQYAAGRCYQKSADVKVMKHCIKAGHLSILEHASATFEVTCSLQTLLQLTRHRHLSFTCQSTRGSKIDSFASTGNEVIDEVNAENLHIYQQLIIGGTPYEEAALMLPKAMEYNLLITGNFRAWYEYLPKRMCMRAQKEHREMAGKIQDLLIEIAPDIFKSCTTKCSTCNEKGCSFNGENNNRNKG